MHVNFLSVNHLIEHMSIAGRHHDIEETQRFIQHIKVYEMLHEYMTL